MFHLRWGCAVDCSFCATGKQGFSRNLSTAEIIGQVWVAENSFGTPRDHGSKNVTNVVMMGMGEPLLNFEPVTEAMNLMMHEDSKHANPNTRRDLFSSLVQFFKTKCLLINVFF